MWKFILKRLLMTLPLLIGILTITFFMVRLAPGDPMDIYLESNRRRQIDPEIIEMLRKKYGLDKPIHVQYIIWIKTLLTGGFFQ